MTVTFVPVGEIPAGLASSLEKCSPYTSPNVLTVLGREFGRAGYFIASIDSEPIAAMPVVLRGRGLLKRLQALIDGLPAPVWIAEGYQTQRTEVGVELVNTIRRQRFMKSYVTDFAAVFPGASGAVREQVTTLVDLNTTTGEYPPDKTLRSEIAKAARDGVKVTPLNRATHMSSFINLVSHADARHARAPRYSSRFWNEFVELSGRDSRVAIWCVESQNELAAAHVFIVDRDIALNWQIYFDKKFSSLKPNQAITAFAIEKFRSEGIRYLNLGATPPEATGVSDYKKKWGGSEYPYRTIEFRSWLGRLLP